MPVKTSDEKVEIRTVSMYPGDWATVESFADTMGYPSTSSALRRIIDEWLELKNRHPLQETVPS